MDFKNKRWKQILLYALIAVMVLIMGYDIIWPDAKDIYNTTEVKTMEATVQGKSTENNAYYLQVTVPGITPSPLYVQASSEFYQQASVGQKVGVLLGLVEKSKARPSLDKKQLKIKYISKEWEVLSLFPSLQEAQQQNQSKTFTTTASLKQRIKSTDGRFYFLFDAGGKNVMAEVSNDYYQKYQPQNTPKDAFELEFAGTGDFNRLVRIVKP